MITMEAAGAVHRDIDQPVFLLGTNLNYEIKPHEANNQGFVLHEVSSTRPPK